MIKEKVKKFKRFILIKFLGIFYLKTFPQKGSNIYFCKKEVKHQSKRK
jgi:hypothetical protein